MNEKSKTETGWRNLQEYKKAGVRGFWLAKNGQRSQRGNQGKTACVSLTSTLKSITYLQWETRANLRKPVLSPTISVLHAVSTSERDEDQDLVIEEIEELSDEKSDSD